MTKNSFVSEVNCKYGVNNTKNPICICGGYIESISTVKKGNTL